MDPLRITTQDLGMSFPAPGARAERVEVLEGIDLEFSAPQLCVLTGPSGRGKTTLLLLLARLLEPTSGEILWDGAPIRREKALLQQGFVYQESHLIDYLSVLENVLLPGLAGEAIDPDSATELLGDLGLSDRLPHRPSQLSTGEQQRVALARALVRKPRVVFADEPTGNLDEENTRIVLDALASAAEEGALVLLASHDPLVVTRAERIIEL